MSKIQQPSSFDVIGSIAILKFPRNTKQKEKKKIAEFMLFQHKYIKTIVEKTDKIKGRLRILKVKHLAGIKTTETLHKETGCSFKLDIEKCYFSSRLSGERLRVANEIKKFKNLRKKMVLVMFAGVAPYSVVIAKIAKPGKIISVELGKECCKYAIENIKLNKLNSENVEIIQGDVKKIVLKLKKKNKKFDVIVMPRPQLKETFLHEAFAVAKKQCVVFYYDFFREDEISGIFEKINKEARKAKRKIKILRTWKAGEIAPYKYRYCIMFEVV